MQTRRMEVQFPKIGKTEGGDETVEEQGGEEMKRSF